jgi:hypothetical protein
MVKCGTIIRVVGEDRQLNRGALSADTRLSVCSVFVTKAGSEGGQHGRKFPESEYRPDGAAAGERNTMSEFNMPPRASNYPSRLQLIGTQSLCRRVGTNAVRAIK